MINGHGELVIIRDRRRTPQPDCGGFVTRFGPHEKQSIRDFLGCEPMPRFEGQNVIRGHEFPYPPPTPCGGYVTRSGNGLMPWYRVNGDAGESVTPPHDPPAR